MQRSNQSVFVIALAIVSGAAVTLGAHATHAESVLYDVDFGTPPHTVGLPPVIGAGPAPRNTVSTISFGSPTVVAAHGPLADQPLAFDSFDGQGDQIGLNLADLPPSTHYTFECQLTVLTQAADFTILFDTPQIRSVRFSPGGTVNALVPGVFSGPIGTFTLGAVVDLRVEISLALDTWTVYLNNLLAHSGSFGGATAVTNVRVSSPVTPNPPGVSAGIDDIVIRETSTVAVEASSWGRIKTLFR